MGAASENTEKSSQVVEKSWNSILGVNQNEGHLARRVAAIHPRVIRASLDQNVARLHMNLRVVQKHVDFAG
jgi:hypothetical protein